MFTSKKKYNELENTRNELEKTYNELEDAHSKLSSKSCDQQRTIEELECKVARFEEERDSIEGCIKAYGDNVQSAIMLRIAIAMESISDTLFASENKLHAIENQLKDFDLNICSSIDRASNTIDTLDTNLWNTLNKER